MKLTLPEIFSQTVKQFPDRPAIGYVGETPYSYKEYQQKINSVIAFFEDLGISPGDKIAILGNNMPNWGITYFATTFMGAISIPLLHEFTSKDIENVLQHSEASVIVVSEKLLPKTKDIQNSYLKHRILLDDFSLLESPVSHVNYQSLEKPANQYTIDEENIATIIYTSGTTGNPKGVMLTHKNLVFTARAGSEVQPIGPNDRFLSILPLSHAYENTLGLILPMLGGASVYYISRLFSPESMLEALKLVRPTIMLTVPLIIEKVYKNSILPKFTENGLIKTLYSIAPFRKVLNRIAGKKLMKTFGGELKFFGIGGAKLDKTVEKFLMEARFPIAIGYGLTETSPLIAGTSPRTATYQSTGPAIKGIEMKIYNADPTTGEGEIWVRGPNVMKGYYKQPDVTAQVITEDGWFRTGDLGYLDKNGFLFFRGRVKNVIVGANGINIYPEDIETVINNFRHVVESIVVQQRGRLVAFVHFNLDELEKSYQSLKDEVSDAVENRIEQLKTELLLYVNSNVNRYAQIQMIFEQPMPFQKTATLKIKRHLYM